MRRLAGRDRVDEDDLAAAVALTLAHRATRIPEQAPPAEEPQADQPDRTESDNSGDDDSLILPEELLLEAVRALLPPDLLARLAGPRRGRPRAAGQARQERATGADAPCRRVPGGWAMGRGSIWWRHCALPHPGKDLGAGDAGT
jgi:magnesium chelatase subunit D